jgi:hypothetical protein
MPVESAITLTDLGFAWPDGTLALDRLDDFLGRLELTRTLSMRLPGVLDEAR